MLPMSSGNSYYDDMRTKPEVIDPPENEDTLDIGENVNDTSESATKPNLAITTNVRELLECPVCLNAMYPPISQVQLLYFINYKVGRSTTGYVSFFNFCLSRFVLDS